MRCAAILSVVFTLFVGVTLAVAADTYTVPPHPASDSVLKCAAAFDKGYPSTTGDAKAWTVTLNGKYNYDDTWQFRMLEVYLIYLPTNKQGPKYTVTDESTLTTKGSFATTFNNVTPPGAGEALYAIGRITVKKTGEIDRSNPTPQTKIPSP